MPDNNQDSETDESLYPLSAETKSHTIREGNTYSVQEKNTRFLPGPESAIGDKMVVVDVEQLPSGPHYRVEYSGNSNNSEVSKRKRGYEMSPTTIMECLEAGVLTY